MEAYDSAALLLAANADVHIRNAGGIMVYYSRNYKNTEFIYPRGSMSWSSSFT